MKKLEDSLIQGNIKIAICAEFLFRATFFPKSGKKVPVYSQKGIEYLFLMLEARILNDKGAEKRANEKFPHDKFSHCKLEHFLNHKLTTISKENDVFLAKCESFDLPDMECDPGNIFTWEGKGGTLLEALEDAQKKKPIVEV